MKIQHKKILFMCLGAFLLFLPFVIDINKQIKINFAGALEVNYPSILGFSIVEGSSFIDYARYFFNIGMAIAGILAIMTIIFGGIYYLISFGRGKIINEGKEWIRAGILGLILLVSSYIIAYTINPNLIDFRLEKLFPIDFFNSSSNTPVSGPPFVTYSEIPLGTLTENLLSGTMDCYDFDGNGDPIEGIIKTDKNGEINGPTLLNHDRIDCFLKLTEAAEKKAKLIKKLSDEIVKLMEQCSCEGKCTVNNPPACSPPTSNKKCAAKEKTCKPLAGESGDCCPVGVKDKIEYGLIKIEYSGQHFDYSNKEFQGLDEFRTKLSNISDFIEIQPKPTVSGKEISIINNGNCKICDTANDTACLNSRKLCLKKSKWGNLKLIEQLMYLQEKMEKIKASIEKDKNQLSVAKTKMADCTLVKSSVDLLGIFEETKKEDKIILKNSIFQDSATNEMIDSSKYCKGFDYANSIAYSKCQNICPETLKNASCYQGCAECNEENSADQANCLKNQTQCVKKCYDNRECPTDTSPFKTFKDCMKGFDNQCMDGCLKKYAGLQENLQKCQDKCNKDSQCLLENEELCTVNFPQLKNCSATYSDSGNLQNCINNSFLCKYGSDEYAGYPDCVKGLGLFSSSFLYKNPNNQVCKTPYAVYTSGANAGQTCLNLYPETAKCPVASLCPKCPCGIINETINYDSGESGGGGGGGPCPNGQPEKLCSDGTISCNCPIGEKNLSNSLCQTSDPSSPGYCAGGNICINGVCQTPGSGGGGGGGSGGGGSGGGGSGGNSSTIKEYQVVVGTCNEFTYVGDPLTFYCRNIWEPEGYVSGEWLSSSKADEIPVGQTVDDTEKWANGFIKNIDDFVKTTGEMVEYMKSIGQEEKYCRCDSTCEGGSPCSSICQYVPKSCSDSTDEDGNTVTTCTPASCARKPCAGLSCQKVINLLKGGSTKNCPVEKNGIFYYYDKIYKASKTFYKFVIIDGRTDILKELSYSRKQMDSCSQQAVKLGKDAVQAFSCTKAYRGTSTLQKRCYGIYDGQLKTPSESRTDNWFCLKTLLK